MFLMTIAGSNYECFYADIGTNDRDDAFALKPNMAKPYS